MIKIEGDRFLEAKFFWSFFSACEKPFCWKVYWSQSCQESKLGLNLSSISQIIVCYGSLRDFQFFRYFLPMTTGKRTVKSGIPPNFRLMFEDPNRLTQKIIRRRPQFSRPRTSIAKGQQSILVFRKIGSSQQLSDGEHPLNFWLRSLVWLLWKEKFILIGRLSRADMSKRFLDEYALTKVNVSNKMSTGYPARVHPLKIISFGDDSFELFICYIRILFFSLLFCGY